MTHAFENDPTTGVTKARGNPPESSPEVPTQSARMPGVRPTFAEIAELLARLHATHAALGAAQYRGSKLVHANLMLERRARALAQELDHARRLALHDPLTGLANRALLADRLEVAILRARREELHLAVMLLDLDGFKAVNDVHGHATGDQVPCETARRALASIRARVDTRSRRYALAIPRADSAATSS